MLRVGKCVGEPFWKKGYPHSPFLNFTLTPSPLSMNGEGVCLASLGCGAPLRGSRMPLRLSRTSLVKSFTSHLVQHISYDGDSLCHDFLFPALPDPLAKGIRKFSWKICSCYFKPPPQPLPGGEGLFEPRFARLRATSSPVFCWGNPRRGFPR